MPSGAYAIDPEQIAQSVLSEFHQRAAVSTFQDATYPTLWHVNIRYPVSRGDSHVLLDCGPGATCVSVRQSIARQLKLEA